MREIFKDIKGFEGLYAVSNLGNVKRHTTEAKNGTQIMDISNVFALKEREQK